MPKAIDLKFRFQAFHAITGKEHTQYDAVVFLARGATHYQGLCGLTCKNADV